MKTANIKRKKEQLLKEQQDHMVWKQRIIGIERMIKKLRQVQNELGLNNLTVVPEEE